jgi:hypothetical protein
VNKNTEALLVTSKVICLEVTAEKTRDMVMSQEQNAVKNRYIKIANEMLS